MYYRPFDRLMKHLERKGRTQIESQDNRPSPEFHTRDAYICRFPREFVTLRVAQFVLNMVNLAISMEPRGPRACSLLPRLWLLVNSWVVMN